MKIKFIPQKIKVILMQHKNIKFELKGHKKISEKKINIIQFKDKSRIWILQEEIKK